MDGELQRHARNGELQGSQELFSDFFKAQLNPFSSVITFGLRALAEDETDRPVVRIRMPLQQAKALAFILLRTIRTYEQQAQVNIELPRKVLESLAIAPEDWDRLQDIE